MKRQDRFKARPQHEQDFFRQYLRWHVIGLVGVITAYVLYVILR